MLKRIILIAVASGVLHACSNEPPPALPDQASRSVLTEAVLQQQVERLALQVAQAEGLRAIKRLEHAYAQYVSAGRWQDAAALFSDTATVRSGELELTGRDAIAGWLQASARSDANGLAPGVLNEHLSLSHVFNLDADGSHAYGRMRQIALKGQYGESATWEAGINENRYVLENGRWKFLELHNYPLFAGPYAAGWRNLKEETQEEVAPVPFHYTADTAGIPAPLPQTPASVAVSGDDVQQLAASLDARAQRLLDEDQIIRLQNAYGYYLDRKLWDDLAELFHSAGTLELGKLGVYEGRPAIRRALEQFGPQVLAPDVVFDHLQFQPVVTVSADGLSAQARGTELQMVGVFDTNASWGVATYQNDYIKTGDIWRLHNVKVQTRMRTHYTQGWALAALPDPAASAEYPPNFPPSENYPVYPDFHSPAFRYPHPVTGAEPRLQLAASDTLALDGRLAELERKVRVLDAYVGAENVSNAYGYYIDEFMWDGMADIFSIDGWKELSYIGSYMGRERVRESVVGRYGRGGRRANSMTFHQKTQPVISVAADGRSAAIRTRLFQLNSSTQAPGSYISGIYENRVVNENGIWRISAMDLDYAWLANYDLGWAQVEPGSSARFAPAPGSLIGPQAPDRGLRGVIFAPYPEGVVDMAFHYRNPVSDRKPPLWLEEVDYDALQIDISVDP